MIFGQHGATNLTKQSLIRSEIAEVDSKINALNQIREQLERDLLKIQEDELELDDERTVSLRSASFQYQVAFSFSGWCSGTFGIRGNINRATEEYICSYSTCRTLAASQRYVFLPIPEPPLPRKTPGPVFLPSEHDELPPAVAFMVCSYNCHTCTRSSSHKDPRKPLIAYSCSRLLRTLRYTRQFFSRRYAASCLGFDDWI